MFKKKIAVAVSAALGFAGMAASQSASAQMEFKSVTVDTAGDQAQVLIFPYYNVANGITTSFNVRNTKDEYKVLRFRFHEGNKSQDVYDFNVYMSPYDIFTVAIERIGNDTVIKTSDTTCTYPSFYTDDTQTTLVDQGLRTFKNTYNGDSDPEFTAEGYLTVIEQGILARNWFPPVGILVNGVITDREWRETVKHIDHDNDPKTTMKPPLCSHMATLWAGGGFAGGFTQGGALASVLYDPNVQDIQDGIGAPPPILVNYASPGTFEDNTFYGESWPDGLYGPTGGIAGASIILDSVRGAAYVSDPTPIAGYANRPQHYDPQDPFWFALPSLASGDTRVSTVTALNNFGQYDSLITYWPYANNDWGLSDPDALAASGNVGVPTGINPFPLSHAIQATMIDNLYYIDKTTGLEGVTDWTATFPMRRHAVYNTYKYGIGLGNAANNQFVWEVVAPSDVVGVIDVWDREESKKGTFASPVEQGNIPFAREVNVLEFAHDSSEVTPGDSSVLSSLHAIPIYLETDAASPEFNSGWAQIDFAAFGYDLDLRNNANSRFRFLVDFTENLVLPGNSYGRILGIPADPTANPVPSIPVAQWVLDKEFFVFDNETIPYRGLPIRGFATTRATLAGGRAVGEIVQHNYTHDID
jgi:hypothetical protein